MRRLIIIATACAVAASTLAYAQAPRRTSSGDTAGPANEIICRRFLRTGTLADFYRVCKTRAEWDAERRNIRQGLSVSDACRDRANGGSLCAQ